MKHTTEGIVKDSTCSRVYPFCVDWTKFRPPQANHMWGCSCYSRAVSR